MQQVFVSRVKALGFVRDEACAHHSANGEHNEEPLGNRRIFRVDLRRCSRRPHIVKDEPFSLDTERRVDT